MADDDEVCSDLFGDFSDFTSRFADAQPGGRCEAHGLETRHAFREDIFVVLDLIANREHEAAIQSPNPARSFDNSKQEYLSAAELSDSRALPQRPASFD